jgi:hypothetical protein
MVGETSMVVALLWAAAVVLLLGLGLSGVLWCLIKLFEVKSRKMKTIEMEPPACDICGESEITLRFEMVGACDDSAVNESEHARSVTK